MTALSVNLNKIALIRNSREGNWPDLLTFATLALKAGAQGITIHPRPDERHARYSDVVSLKEIVARFPEAELNIEGYPCPRFMETVLEVIPHQVTLVPDDPNQKTSDHGWKIRPSQDLLLSTVGKLRAAGIRVSLFMDPDPEEIALVPEVLADRIELYTGPYAHEFAHFGVKALDSYIPAAQKARSLGLGLNAGHDLNQENLKELLKALSPDEVSIGHALTVEALLYGFEETIRRYLRILQD